MSSQVAAPESSSVRPRAGREKPTGINVAWVPNEDLERPEWIRWGRRLGVMGRVSNWWIGDWLQYGAVRWGEKYTEAARITGYDVKTLRNIAYVAKRFDLSRRRDKLTWSHHAEVAVLDPQGLHRQARRLTLAQTRSITTGPYQVDRQSGSGQFPSDMWFAGSPLTRKATIQPLI